MKFSILLDRLHPRTSNTWKQIIASLFVKGGSILVNLALVPISIRYLGTEEYGIWVTFASLILWIEFLDIGIGNGLRNDLAVAIAKGDKRKAREMVSTAYLLLSVIFLSLGLLFFLINPYISWATVFGASPALDGKLSLFVLIAVSFFCLQLIFKLVGNVLLAFQLPAWNNAIMPIGNLLVLIALLLVMNSGWGTDQELIVIGLLYSVLPLISYMVASVILFRFSSYRQYAPSFKFVNLNYSNQILSYGALFFLIQISAVILQTGNNFLISHIYSPKEVTPYDVSFKYMNVLRMVFLIIIVPYWSAVTEAFTKKELGWIRSSYRTLFRITLVFIAILGFMLFAADWVYAFWVGNEVIISWEISLSVAVFVGVFIYTELPFQFLNGIGKIKLQAIVSVLVLVLNIPLAILLSRTPLGLAGVILAPVICRCIKYVICLIQYKKIIAAKAYGIWAA